MIDLDNYTFETDYRDTAIVGCMQHAGWHDVGPVSGLTISEVINLVTEHEAKEHS